MTPTCRRGCNWFRDRCRRFFAFLHLLSWGCARVAAGAASRRRRWHLLLHLTAQRYRGRTQFVQTVLSRRRGAVRRRTVGALARVVDHQVLVALFTIALLSGRTRTALLRRIVDRGSWSTNLGYLHGLYPCRVPSSVSSPEDVRAVDRACCAACISLAPPAISSFSATQSNQYSAESLTKPFDKKALWFL